METAFSNQAQSEADDILTLNVYKYSAKEHSVLNLTALS